MKVLLVIAQDGFRDEEYLVPKKTFEEAGIKIITASGTLENANGMLGAVVEPDIEIDKIDVEEFGAIVVVGGRGAPQYLYNNSVLHDVLREAYSSEKIVAGICLSGAVLANAGVLKGKKATVYATPESLTLMKKGGADYIKEGVVTDGRIVTAEGPAYAKNFADSILKLIE